MKKFTSIALTTALMLVAFAAFSQVGPPPPPPPLDPPPGAVPIDGGAFALLAGGIYYGFKKLYGK